MNRSRAASAPQAIQAWMSSRVKWGYATNTSSIESPLARKSRINDTQTRVPLMHGSP